MFFHQRFVPGLAIASYLVGDEKSKQAAVIDPTRDVDDFLVLARDNGGLNITHILETHVHADFASGATELKSRLGGAPRIVSSAMGGAEWTPQYADVLARDGDEVSLGSIRLRCVHTPGHTPEHVSWMLFDDSRSRDTPWLVFTGDFLFVGDVGRPDLLGEQQRVGLAHQLYDTTFRRVAPWPDFVEVFPAHGAGSLCGKAIGSRRSSSMGFERRFSAALKALPEGEWVKRLMSGMPPAPPYFARMKRVNVEGPPVLGAHLPGQRAMSIEQLRRAIDERATPLDVRSKEVFAAGHVRGAINIPLSGNFATWAGWLLDYETPAVLIVDEPRAAHDAALQLIRIGFDRIAGHFDFAAHPWPSPATIETISPPAAAEQLRRSREQNERPFLLDVRTDSEFAAGHVDGSTLIHVGLLPQRLSDVPRDRRVLVICGSGHRAGIAASLLKRHGHVNVANITGGIDAWRAASLPLISST